MSRLADRPIDPEFPESGSRRVFAGVPISQTDLLTMLEAAKALTV